MNLISLKTINRERNLLSDRSVTRKQRKLPRPPLVSVEDVMVGGNAELFYPQQVALSVCKMEVAELYLVFNTRRLGDSPGPVGLRGSGGLLPWPPASNGPLGSLKPLSSSSLLPFGSREVLAPAMRSYELHVSGD